jgi:hypothetical protein
MNNRKTANLKHGQVLQEKTGSVIGGLQGGKHKL